MNDKIEKELRKLTEDKEELLEKFQTRKEEFAESMLNFDCYQILRMDRHTEYTRLMDTARELGEIKVKRRVLLFAIENQS